MIDISVVDASSAAALQRGWTLLQPYRYASDDAAHLAYLLAQLNPTPGATVLDIGSGFGAVAEGLHAIRPDLQFTLLNLSAVQLALDSPFAKLHASAHDIPVTDASFDAAMMQFSLCNMDYKLALAEASRVLKPGGVLLLNDFARVSGDNRALHEFVQCEAHPESHITQFAADMGLVCESVHTPTVHQYYLRDEIQSDAAYDAAFAGTEPRIWRFIRADALPVAARVGRVIGRHTRIALQVSGGKDSIATLNLLRPWLDRVTVYWCNTGAALPESVAYIDRVAATVPSFRVIQGRQPQIIDTDGWPSDVVPQDYTTDGNAVFGPTPFKVQTRLSCCIRSLMLPMHERMVADGITLVIRGKRRDEDDKTGVESGPTDAGYEVLFPIMEWTSAQVHGYLDAHGIAKHPAYQTGNASLDCMTCTAWWGDGLVPYLKVHHTDLHAVVTSRIQRIRAAVDAAFSAYEV